MIFRRLISALVIASMIAAPALAADRKPIVLGASGQQQQIQSADTLSIPSAKVTGISGSTQCVQANSSGLLSGTGAACGGGGGSTFSPFYDPGVFAISAPALGPFTLATSSGATATLTSLNSRGIVLNVSSSANAVASAMTAVASQTAFTTTAFIVPNWNTTSTTVFIGLGIKDSTGKIDAFGERSSSGVAIGSHFTFTSALVLNTATNSSFQFAGANSPHWLRVKMSSGNFIGYISFDGENWQQTFSVVATSFLGSTLSSVGLVAENNATGVQTFVPLMSFSNTTP